MKFRSTNITVESSKIAKSHCIILLSDLHCDKTWTKEQYDAIYEEITKQIVCPFSPIYICIAGDLVDNINMLESKECRNNLQSLIDNLNKIGPVLAVNGNHDVTCYENNTDKDSTLQESLTNIHFLTEKQPNFSDPVLNIQGFSMPYSWYKKRNESSIDFANTLKTLKLNRNANFTHFLFHTPTPFVTNNQLNIQEFKELEHVDLFLAGHKHGGLMPRFITKLNHGHGLYLPHKPLFPDGCDGVYKTSEQALVISRGIVKLVNKGFLANHINKLYRSDIYFIHALEGDEKIKIKSR